MMTSIELEEFFADTPHEEIPSHLRPALPIPEQLRGVRPCDLPEQFRIPRKQRDLHDAQAKLCGRKRTNCEMTVHDFADAYYKATGELADPIGPSRYSASCPAHDDSNPSFSFTEAEDGTLLFNCLAGCEQDDVVEAMGLTWFAVFNTGTGAASQHNRGSLKPATIHKPTRAECESLLGLDPGTCAIKGTFIPSVDDGFWTIPEISEFAGRFPDSDALRATGIVTGYFPTAGRIALSFHGESNIDPRIVQYRATSNDEKNKYFNDTGVQAKAAASHISSSRSAPYRVLICEGATDAIAGAIDAGDDVTVFMIRGAQAAGKAIREVFAICDDRLNIDKVEFIVSADNDEAGHKFADTISKILTDWELPVTTVYPSNETATRLGFSIAQDQTISDLADFYRYCGVGSIQTLLNRA